MEEHLIQSEQKVWIRTLRRASLIDPGLVQGKGVYDNGCTYRKLLPKVHGEIKLFSIFFLIKRL